MFVLARALSRTVRELLATIDAHELAEWEAVYAVEPWGDTRGDLQTAMLAAIVANQWRKGSPARPIDYVPDFWRENQTEPSPSKMLAVGRAFAAFTRRKPGG